MSSLSSGGVDYNSRQAPRSNGKQFASSSSSTSSSSQAPAPPPPSSHFQHTGEVSENYETLNSRGTTAPDQYYSFNHEAIAQISEQQYTMEEGNNNQEEHQPPPPPPQQYEQITITYPDGFVEAVYKELIIGALQDNVQFSCAELTVFLSSPDFQALLSESLNHSLQANQIADPLYVSNLVMSLLVNQEVKENNTNRNATAGEEPQQLYMQGEEEETINEEVEQAVGCMKCSTLPDNYLEFNCEHSFCLSCMAYWFLEKGYHHLLLQRIEEIEVECLICFAAPTLLDCESVEAVLQTIKLLEEAAAAVSTATTQEEQRNRYHAAVAETIYEESGETFQTEETGRNRTTSSCLISEKKTKQLQQERFTTIGSNNKKQKQQQQQQQSSSASDIILNHSNEGSSSSNFEGHKVARLQTPSQSLYSAASSSTAAPLSDKASKQSQSHRGGGGGGSDQAKDSPQGKNPSQSQFIATDHVRGKQQFPSSAAAATTLTHAEAQSELSEQQQQQYALEKVKEELDDEEEEEMRRHIHYEQQQQSHIWVCPSHPRNEVGFINFSRMCCVCVLCLQSGDCASQDISSFSKSHAKMIQLTENCMQQTHICLNLLGLQQSKAVEGSSHTAEEEELLSTVTEQMDKILASIDLKRDELLTKQAENHHAETERVENEKASLLNSLSLLNALEKQLSQLQINNSATTYNAFAQAIDIFHSFLSTHREALTLPAPQESNRTNTFTYPELKQVEEAEEEAENTARQQQSFNFADQIDALQFKIARLQLVGVLARNPSASLKNSATKQASINWNNSATHNLIHTTSPPAAATQVVGSGQNKPYYYKSSAPLAQKLQSRLFQKQQQMTGSGNSNVSPSFELLDQYRVSGGGMKGSLLWNDEEDEEEAGGGGYGTVEESSNNCQSLSLGKSLNSFVMNQQKSQLMKHAPQHAVSSMSLNQSGISAASGKYLNTTGNGNGGGYVNNMSSSGLHTAVNQSYHNYSAVMGSGGGNIFDADYDFSVRRKQLTDPDHRSGSTIKLSSQLPFTRQEKFMETFKRAAVPSKTTAMAAAVTSTKVTRNFDAISNALSITHSQHQQQIMSSHRQSPFRQKDNITAAVTRGYQNSAEGCWVEKKNSTLSSFLQGRTERVNSFSKFIAGSQNPASLVSQSPLLSQRAIRRDSSKTIAFDILKGGAAINSKRGGGGIPASEQQYQQYSKRSSDAMLQLNSASKDVISTTTTASYATSAYQSLRAYSDLFQRQKFSMFD